MLSGWKKRSFAERDMNISRATQFSLRHVDHKFNKEYFCKIMEIYSQEVNGTNVKVLLLGRHLRLVILNVFHP